jgi:hypothetical protein
VVVRELFAAELAEDAGLSDLVGEDEYGRLPSKVKERMPCGILNPASMNFRS